MSYIEVDVNGNALFNAERHQISVLRCCEEWCSPDKKIERRTRGYYSLHFIIGGKGTLVYEMNGQRQEVVLQKGDSFLLFAGEKYEYYPDPERPWGYDWIDFTGSQAEDLFSACGYDKEKPFIHIRHFDRLRSLLGALSDAYDVSEVQNLRCSGYFLVLISYLVEDMRQMLNRRDESQSKKFQRLRNILIYINNNYRRELDVETVALHACVSPDYLKHLFSELLGMPLTEYLNRFRISSACEKFRQSDAIGIEEIAAEVGYADAKYFARVFKKIKGMSASEYRKSGTSEDPFAWLKERNIDYR